MNILIIGSGAREHAFCWKLAQSKKTEKVYVVPGNAGTAELATNLDFDVSKFKDLKKNILKNSIKLVLVGPEIPLINGVVDQINNDKELEHILVVGPSKKGALLEGSKDFSKEFMQRHKIPTAGYKTFNTKTLELGLKYLESVTPPFVLKADGPAAGKGVLILDNLEDAKKELISMLKNNKFGSSGHRVVVEEFLEGIELSCFVLTDGKSYKILPNAKDYKRIGEGDTGLNTGGMGSISPVSFAVDLSVSRSFDTILAFSSPPIIAVLQSTSPSITPVSPNTILPPVLIEPFKHPSILMSASELRLPSITEPLEMKLISWFLSIDFNMI